MWSIYTLCNSNIQLFLPVLNLSTCLKCQIDFTLLVRWLLVRLAWVFFLLLEFPMALISGPTSSRLLRPAGVPHMLPCPLPPAPNACIFLFPLSAPAAASGTEMSHSLLCLWSRVCVCRACVYETLPPCLFFQTTPLSAMISHSSLQPLGMWERRDMRLFQPLMLVYTQTHIEALPHL